MEENSISSNGVDNKNKGSFTLRFDYRIMVVVLLVIIAVMLALWRPWSSAHSNSARTISVTGDATIKATPDEYIFTPNYQLKDADKSVASQMAVDKQNQVVAGLKKLGVADSQIKADQAGYTSFYDQVTDAYNYADTLTITIESKDLAQKVQDFLVSTAPDGQVTPTAQFSHSLQTKLEAQARDQATKDARAKAEQSAKNLGFALGKVKSVNDGGFIGGSRCGGDYLCPLTASGTYGAGSASSLSIQPGQNNLDYSVTVVYYVK